ncbi:MAG: Npt1/Npt2 family nucleotide transporter [Vicinamibacterales bacterium]
MVLRLQRLLDVRAGEGLPVLLSFLYVACVVAAFLLAKPIRNSLYLVEYGPYRLVYAYAAVPLALSIFVPVYGLVAARIGTRLATIGTLLFFCLNVLWFWWAFTFAPFELLPAVFYVWVNCFGVIAPVQAWSFANSLFDARQARRLFGLVGAGASVGAISGGVLARYLVEPAGGTVNMLLVLAALIFAGAIIVAMAARRLRRPRTAKRRRATPIPFKAVFHSIAGSPYLRLLAALVFVVAIATQWTTFQLSLVVDQEYGADRDGMTRFFGTFSFIVGAVGLAVQVLLTGALLRHVGVAAVILFLPLAVAFGSALIVAFPAFLAVLLTNAGDQGLRFSIDKAAYELLYLPIAPGQRQAVKNALDIVVNRIADAAGAILLGLATGGFLMLPGAGFGVRGIAAITLAVTLGWIVVAWRLRVAYVAAIGDSIHTYRIDTERSSAAALDASVRATLCAKLASPSPAEVRDALDAILGNRVAVPVSDLHRLLGHADAAVRARALAGLAQAGDRTAAARAEGLLRDADLEVRTQALLYLARDGGFDPLRRIEQLGEFPDFSIRAATVAYLASPGRGRNEEAARVLLEQMAGSPEPRDRAEAARVLALVPDPPADLLIALMQDPDGAVSEQAMKTAHSPGAASAVNALVEALVSGLFGADTVLRQRLITTLNKLKQRHPQMVLDGTLIDLLLAAEIAGHYRSYQALAQLKPDHAAHAHIVDALRDAMDQELERIFRLIALLSPATSLHDAYVGVRSENNLVRANALEYLENVLRPDLREVLLPLIDPLVSDAERARLADRFVGATLGTADEAVAALLASDDPWLRSRVEIAANRAGEAAGVEGDHTPAPVGMHTDVGAA